MGERDKEEHIRRRRRSVRQKKMEHDSKPKKDDVIAEKTEHEKRLERIKKGRDKRRKKKFSVVSTIILIIAIIVFCISGYKLFSIYYGYHKGDQEYDKLAEIGIKQNVKADADSDKNTGSEETSRYTVDFEELWKVNQDIVAWIRFDEPSIINYPVVQGKDNQEYLDKTISGYPNTYGAIFLNVYNNKNFSDKNSIIYGHRMNSKSMFGKLEEYHEESFYKQYPYFYLYTPDGKEIKYQIFAVAKVKDTSEAYTTSFADTETFRQFVQFGKEHSFYDTGVNVPDDAQVVTLSTCTKANNEERLIVQAYKAEER